jgi:hypothetical protein
MRLKNLLVPSSALAASLMLLVPSDARACKFGGCWPGAFLPSGGDVPASLLAVLWFPQQAPNALIDPTQIELVQWTVDGEVPVPATAALQQNGRYLITPGAPLLPDADYEIRAGQFCSFAPYEPWPTKATLHTTSAAPLPTTLGKVATYMVPPGPLSVSSVNGACSTTITAASERVEIVLSPEAAPWEHVLAYETLVDGEAWPGKQWFDSEEFDNTIPLGGSWQGRGRDLLYARCDIEGDEAAADGLPPGAHSVKMRATLPGTDIWLETEPVSFDLICPQPEAPPGMITDEGDQTRCSVAAPGEGALATWAAGAMALALAAMGARKRRA